jgi:hypothetical protein
MRKEEARAHLFLSPNAPFIILSSYVPFSLLFAPRHAGQTLVPFPWQFVQGRCMAVLLGCRPWPRQTGHCTEPFPLHSGQGIIAGVSAMGTSLMKMGIMNYE